MHGIISFNIGKRLHGQRFSAWSSPQFLTSSGQILVYVPQSGTLETAGPSILLRYLLNE